MSAAEQIGDGETLTVRIPLRLRKRGGRKLVVVPEGATAWVPPRARVDSAIVKAIARAHRWRRMLEDGTYATIAELAAAEKINQSYVCRILRLTLLAPSIVEPIADGRQQGGMDLATLLKTFRVDWRSNAMPAGSYDQPSKRLPYCYGFHRIDRLSNRSDCRGRQSLCAKSFIAQRHFACGGRI